MTGRAETSRTGPNDSSRVVWGIYSNTNVFFFFTNPYPYPRISGLNPSISVPMHHGYGYRRVRIRMTPKVSTGYPCRTLTVDRSNFSKEKRKKRKTYLRFETCRVSSLTAAPFAYQRSTRAPPVVVVS